MKIIKKISLQIEIDSGLFFQIKNTFLDLQRTKAEGGDVRIDMEWLVKVNEEFREALMALGDRELL